LTNSSEPVLTDPRRRKWSRRWLLALVSIAALITALALVLDSRVTYKEWPWSSYPSVLHVCGRDFQNDGRESTQQIAESGQHLIPLGSVPGWLNHGQLSTTTTGGILPGTHCHTGMWVRLSSHTYEVYDLEGSA
jgi:hypothetical protein